MENLLVIIFLVCLCFILISTAKVKSKNEIKVYQEQKKKERSTITKQLTKFVEEHHDALISHWHTGRKKDEYGQIDESQWITEATRFLKIVNHGKLKDERIPNFVGVSEISIIVEKLIEERKNTQETTSIPNAPSTSVFVNREIKDAWDFEKLCSDELNQMGWIAYVPTGGADQGIDVIATKDTIKLILQCKLYNSTVGNKAVQEAIAGKAFEDADYAAVVAPNGFTKSARELALKTKVLLLHPRDIQEIDHLLKGIS